MTEAYFIFRFNDVYLLGLVEILRVCILLQLDNQNPLKWFNYNEGKFLLITYHVKENQCRWK